MAIFIYVHTQQPPTTPIQNAPLEMQIYQQTLAQCESLDVLNFTPQVNQKQQQQSFHEFERC
jgi:hypothetical protein